MLYGYKEIYINKEKNNYNQLPFLNNPLIIQCIHSNKREIKIKKLYFK